MLLYLPLLLISQSPADKTQSLTRTAPWISAVQVQESSILLGNETTKKVTARVAFPAGEILEIRSSNGKQKFEPGDWNLSKDGLNLTFTNLHEFPVLWPKDLFPPRDSPKSYRHRVGHPEQNMLYGPGRWFHDRQIEITYKPKTLWSGPKPVSFADQLPKTTAKLKAGQPITLGISGDSISTGLDASAMVKAEPNQPGYPWLVASELQMRYGSKVKLVNRAVSGTSITFGNSDWPKLLESKPDLVIVAYGMNDVGRRDPAWFGKQTRELIEKIRSTGPEAEIILVSSMIGHKEWIHTPREMFPLYRDQLRSLTGPGVALADVTSVWETYLKNKHDHDLTGNGLNHPNDFGHRLYAQTILTGLGADR